jgi:hypothetical protein
MSQLEIKVGVIKPDLDLNRMYTHGLDLDLEQDSKDQKTFERLDGCPTSTCMKS